MMITGYSLMISALRPKKMKMMKSSMMPETDERVSLTFRTRPSGEEATENLSKCYPSRSVTHTVTLN